MKAKNIKVGMRVRLKADNMLDFKSGDVGTIVKVDNINSALIRFDIPRNGFSNTEYDIPKLCGLWVDAESDLRKYKD